MQSAPQPDCRRTVWVTAAKKKVDLAGWCEPVDRDGISHFMGDTFDPSITGRLLAGQLQHLTIRLKLTTKQISWSKMLPRLCRAAPAPAP